MKQSKPVLILVCLAIVGYLAFRVLFPDERTVIMRRLNDLSKTATVNSETSTIARGLKANKATEFLTDDISVVIEMPDGNIQRAAGDDIHTAVKTVLASPQYHAADLKFYDILVELGPDKSTAQVELNMVLDLNGEPAFLAQEWNVSMVKEEKDWKIRRIESVAPYTR